MAAPLAIEVSRRCVAALERSHTGQLWHVVVIGDVESDTYAIGPSADAVSAAYLERYRGDWRTEVRPLADAGQGPTICAWCSPKGCYC